MLISGAHSLILYHVDIDNVVFVCFQTIMCSLKLNDHMPYYVFQRPHHETRLPGCDQTMGLFRRTGQYSRSYEIPQATRLHRNRYVQCFSLMSSLINPWPESGLPELSG